MKILWIFFRWFSFQSILVCLASLVGSFLILLFFVFNFNFACSTVSPIKWHKSKSLIFSHWQSSNCNYIFSFSIFNSTSAQNTNIHFKLASEHDGLSTSGAERYNSRIRNLRRPSICVHKNSNLRPSKHHLYGQQPPRSGSTVENWFEKIIHLDFTYCINRKNGKTMETIHRK